MRAIPTVPGLSDLLILLSLPALCQELGVAWHPADCWDGKCRQQQLHMPEQLQQDGTFQPAACYAGSVRHTFLNVSTTASTAIPSVNVGEERHVP